jgi:hypothetical protein
MTEVERQLRDMLSRYAHDAPDGHLMLTRVRQVAARRRRRRLALTGGVSLAAMLAVSGAVSGAVSLADRPARVQPTLPVGRGQDVMGVEFVAGTPVDLTFPFAPPAAPVPGTRPVLTLVAGRPTLQYLPPDLATAPAAGPSALATPSAAGPSASAASGAAEPGSGARSGTQSDASPSTASSDGSGAAGGYPTAPQDTSRAPGIKVQSQTTHSQAGQSQAGQFQTGQSETDGGATDQLAADPVTVVAAGSPWTDGPFTPALRVRSTTVHGSAGVIGERPSTDGAPDYVLTWTEPGGPWVGISAPKTVSTVDLTEFASRLTRQPITQPGPFDFDLVPAGLRVDNITASTVTFCPPAVAASPDFVDKLVVSLDAEPSGPQDGQLVKVGGRAGWLHTVEDVTILRVDEGNGFSLTVQVPRRLRIDEPDLLRFAAGVHVTAAASPARG